MTYRGSIHSVAKELESSTFTPEYTRCKARKTTCQTLKTRQCRAHKHVLTSHRTTVESNSHGKIARIGSQGNFQALGQGVHRGHAFQCKARNDNSVVLHGIGATGDGNCEEIQKRKTQMSTRQAGRFDTLPIFKHTVAVAHGFYFENLTLLGHFVKRPIDSLQESKAVWSIKIFKETEGTNVRQSCTS